MTRWLASIAPDDARRSAFAHRKELRNPESFRGLTGRVAIAGGEFVAIHFPGRSDLVVIERDLAYVWPEG